MKSNRKSMGQQMTACFNMADATIADFFFFAGWQSKYYPERWIHSCQHMKYNSSKEKIMRSDLVPRDSLKFRIR